MDNGLQAQVAELKRVNHEQEFRLAALEALVSNYLSSIIFDADDDRPELPVDRIRAMLGRKGLPFYPHLDEDIALISASETDETIPLGWGRVPDEQELIALTTSVGTTLAASGIDALAEIEVLNRATAMALAKTSLDLDESIDEFPGGQYAEDRRSSPHLSRTGALAMTEIEERRPPSSQPLCGNHRH